jgi:hypothetical protein
MATPERTMPARAPVGQVTVTRKAVSLATVHSQQGAAPWGRGEEAPAARFSVLPVLLRGGQLGALLDWARFLRLLCSRGALALLTIGHALCCLAVYGRQQFGR